MSAHITQDPAARQASYSAGISGGSSMPPPEIADRLAYASGLIEGKTAKRRAVDLWRKADFSVMAASQKAS